MTGDESAVTLSWNTPIPLTTNIEKGKEEMIAVFQQM